MQFMITKGFLQFYSNISGEKCIRLFEMPSLQFVYDTRPCAFVEKKLQIGYLKCILIPSIMSFCAPSCVHVYVCLGPLNFVDTRAVIGLLNFFTKESLHNIKGKQCVQDCIVVHGMSVFIV